MPKQLYNEPSPLETRILSRRFGLEEIGRLSYARRGFVRKKNLDGLERVRLLVERAAGENPRSPVQ